MISEKRRNEINGRRVDQTMDTLHAAFRDLDVPIKEDDEVVELRELKSKVKGLAKLAKRKRLEYDAMRTAPGTSGEVNKNVIVNGVVKWKPVDKTAALVVSKRPQM